MMPAKPPVTTRRDWLRTLGRTAGFGSLAALLARAAATDRPRRAAATCGACPWRVGCMSSPDLCEAGRPHAPPEHMR